MKLQKLIHDSQAWSLAWGDGPLFMEPIEAWDQGPVVRSLWEVRRGAFNIRFMDIASLGDPAVLSTSQAEDIDSVLQVYGQFSAERLSDMTHAESPWIYAYKWNTEITCDALSGYYRTVDVTQEPLDAQGTFLLKSLLAKVTPQVKPDLVDWGDPVGRETW